jgi:hypothetical protein
MVASGARVVVAAKTPGSALEMVGEYWDRYKYVPFDNNVNPIHSTILNSA